MKKSYKDFRSIALAEGLSFLVLLFIAMPLKYSANLPQAVTIVGGLHGVLFVALGILALKVKIDCKKNFGWLVKTGLASLLPFGTFVMDKQWKKEQQALQEDAL